VFSWPPGIPKASVVDPESSPPGTATSANWFSGPVDLGWPPQISLDSEEVELDVGNEPTSVEEDSLVDVTVPPSFQTVACSVAPEDISELLHEVPSTQPRRRQTSESQEQPPELLGPKDAEVEVVMLTPLCQQPPPRPWLQAGVLPSFGESGTMPGHPAHQPARIMGYRYRTRAAPSPCTLVETAQSPPVAQYRVPMPPLQASPLASSRPPILDIKEPLNSLLWTGQFEQKEAEAAAQAAAPTDILLESSMDGRQHPLTSPSTSVLHCGVGCVPRSVQYLSWTVTAHCPVALAGQLTCYGKPPNISRRPCLCERPSSSLPSKLVHLQSSCLPSEIHIVLSCQDSLLTCLDTCKLYLFSQTTAILHFINICNIS